ncbi:hypothetical protein BN159_0100 [Streptomyces davaonensis JCM 4913]|uniref:Hint domain-containing protein n=1 Tax=Streptomyces davaonensis (strain DSM 101723 / JCM 4913 / KCC S-0913 / 768) TaxID=1214101 RepID=K4QVS5_STRDJ|nr:hypothetical protein [Streptomyces davaonensis]CCK24479.1 hypothetical protein BN159_0100 [Streptomyces davaonensis JCM 4913]
MPSQKCIENVQSAPPPGNVWCGDDLCAQAQQSLDHHCSANGYRPDDAWVLFVNGTWCSCCCSCYGQDTPIEAQPGVFLKVQDIRTGDTVLAAGKGLVWQPAQVAFASGMQTPQPAYPVLNVIYRFDRDDVRVLQVTDDTLFLMTTGLLKSAEVLVPGDRLRRADGGEAEIIGPVTKTLAVGVHSIEMGPFDGVNLDGHLLNTYGVVTADLSVQRVHSRGDLRSTDLIDENVLREDIPVAGTEEYLTRNRPTKEFLDEVEAAGIRLDPSALEPPRPLVTIPPEAKGFLHPEQAEQIRATAPLFASNNTFRITVAQKMLDLARPHYDDVVMLIDWNNSLPGAYAWVQLRQKFVVVTGGLLRIKSLTEAGLALVLTHVLAYHEGAECVGEADHTAINDLRRLWPPSLFPMMCERAVEEIKSIFGYVDETAAREFREDRCNRPSLDCRMKAYVAAMGMQPVPECALPEKPDDERDDASPQGS